jgi:hypothetical protein
MKFVIGVVLKIVSTTIECCGCYITPVSYSGGPGLKPKPEAQLF